MNPRSLVASSFYACLLFALHGAAFSSADHMLAGVRRDDQVLGQFRARADLIQVDVSVLDKQRRPVSGLSAEDFTILENGVPQTVSAFAAIELANNVEGSAAWLTDAPADVQTNRIDEGRLFVLFIDDQRLNGPLARERVHAIGRAFIGQLSRSDRTAVVYVVKQTAGQEFTGDPSRVLAAVERFDGQPQGFVTRPLDGLSQLIDALTAVPGRRKSVVYVSLGEDFDPEIVASATSPTTAFQQGDQSQLLSQMRNLFRRAQLANVNIYGIDATGLAAPTPEGFDRSRNRREFMQIVSHETGGTAIVNNNQPERAVPRILEENGSYYLLGYQSSNQKADGKYRRITVKVNRPDVEVRARGGYYAPRPEDAKTPARAPEYKALVDVIPTSGLPMAVTLAPFAHQNRTDMSVAIGLALPAAEGKSKTLQTRVSIFDEHGKALGSQNRNVTLAAGAGAPNHDVLVLSRLDVPRGAYHVRISAHDPDEDRTGSVYADVAAPDFGEEPLSLSGLVLEDSSTVVAAPSAALAQLVPVIPATNRTFPAAAQVRAFVRVYQGGSAGMTPVQMTCSIRDGHDRVAFSADRVLDPARFSPDRAADFLMPLPLGQLEPGPHLLTMEAKTASGASARRQLRFARR